jgi:hypothetical protein
MNPAAAPCLTLVLTTGCSTNRRTVAKVKVGKVRELGEEPEENGVAESGGLIDGTNIPQFLYQTSGQQQSRPLIMRRKSYNMINFTTNRSFADLLIHLLRRRPHSLAGHRHLFPVTVWTCGVDQTIRDGDFGEGGGHGTATLIKLSV